jgi:hypothetical protein
MPTPTYTPLATVTLASATSSVSFSNIPASYRDLVLILNGKATAGGSGARLRVNGDTSTNYPNIRMYGYSGGTGSDAGTGAFLDIGAMNTNDGYQSVVQFMDYSATDKHKTILSRPQESSLGAVLANAGRWSNTAAITSILVYAGSDQFASGFTATLYGIAS